MAILLDSLDQDVVLPGSSFFFEVDTPEVVPVSQGSIVLVPFTADWGPENTPQLFRRYREYLNGGPTVQGHGPNDTVGRRRVFGAFLGEGLPGKGGAGAVLGYRMVGSAGAAAAHTLANTAAAPAVAITAAYKGSRGNTFGLTTRVGSQPGTDQVVIIENSREVETFEYPTGNITTLVANINATTGSRVKATMLATGVALASVANVALTGGNDGASLIAGDWTAMLDAVAYEPFGVFAAAGLTDSSILATLYAWQDEVAALGKPFYIAEGGPASESFAAHKTRAVARNTPDAVVFGTGSVGDSTLTADGSEVIISTAEAVCRVAGAMARRGEAIDLVNVRFAGWRIVSGATRPQAVVAATAGMTLLSRDGDPVAPTKIQLGVTSYSVPDPDGHRPLWHFSNVKFVATDHGLEVDITSDQEHGDLIGDLGVSDRGREIVLGRAHGIVLDRIRRGILQPRSTVMLDPDVVIDDNSDEIALAYDVYDVRGLRKIRNRIRLH